MLPPKEGYESETAKCNHMLEAVPDGAWTLWIDPDEILKGNIRSAIPPDTRADIIPMRVVDPQGHSLYYNRLFRKKQGITFATHHSLLLPNGGICELYLGNAPESVYLLHERIEV
jgi:hypothetical protein